MLYKKIVGSVVKIIHRDGSRITVTNGVLEEYDDNINTLMVKSNTGKQVFINASSIDKLEVEE